MANDTNRERCCLCTVPITSNRKIVLNGRSTSAIEVKEYLRRFLYDVLSTDIASTGLSNSKIGICRRCIAEIRRIKATTASLEAMKSRLKDQLCSFVSHSSASHDPGSTPCASVDRRRHLSLSMAPPAQYFALEPEDHVPTGSESHAVTTPVRAREKRQASRVGVRTKYMK